MFLSETYSIEDCILYNTMTSSAFDSHITNQSMVYSYTTNGLQISNGNWGGIWLNNALPSDVTIELDITAVSGSSTPKFYCGLVSVIETNTDQIEFSSNATGHFKLEKNGTTVKQYLGTSLVSTLTYSKDTAYWKTWTGGNRYFTMKNIKVKPL